MTSDFRAVTAVGLGLVLALVGIYDLFMGVHLGSDQTISALTRAWARSYPLLPFAAGVLASHLFGF